MFKLLVSLFICFSFNILFADNINSSTTKETKKKELSKEDEDFLKKIQQLKVEQNEAKNKTEEAKKVGKTLDELNDKLGVDKENSKQEQKKVNKQTDIKNKEVNNEDDSSKKLIELQEKTKKAQERVKKGQEREESLNKLEKTVNELNGTLGIKK